MELTSAVNIIFFIAAATVAVSYGWGMRGTTLGGEAGAMLPGAILGALIAIFSGSDFLREHFYLLSAAGALGMYFGGTMSYGQTIGLCSNQVPPKRPTRELVGLGVKGALWFGIFGAVVGMFLSSMTVLYDLKSILMAFAFLPVFAFCGSRLFDRPYNEAKGIHPKIYFSITRPEGMGVLFGILVNFVLFMALRKDTVGLALTMGGVLSGGIGWVVAQALQIAAKRGKFFSKAQGKQLIDTWKIMECVLGAIGGLGIAVTFTLVSNFFFKYKAYYTDLSLPLRIDLPEWALPTAFVCLLALYMIRYVIKKPPTKEGLDFQLKRSLISPEEHEIGMQNVSKGHSKAFKLYERVMEIAQFPIYCVVPLFFLFLGSGGVAKLVSFYLVYYVLVEHQVFVRFNRFKAIWLWRISLLGFGFFIVFAQFFWKWTPGPFETFLMYGAFYEALTLVGLTAKNSPDRYGKKSAKESSLIEAYGSQITVHAYFIVCVALITVGVAWL